MFHLPRFERRIAADETKTLLSSAAFYKIKTSGSNAKPCFIRHVSE
jgi:hypothetical protein